MDKIYIIMSPKDGEDEMLETANPMVACRHTRTRLAEISGSGSKVIDQLRNDFQPLGLRIVCTDLNAEHWILKADGKVKVRVSPSKWVAFQGDMHDA